MSRPGQQTEFHVALVLVACTLLSWYYKSLLGLIASGAGTLAASLGFGLLARAERRSRLAFGDHWEEVLANLQEAPVRRASRTAGTITGAEPGRPPTARARGDEAGRAASAVPEEAAAIPPPEPAVEPMRVMLAERERQLAELQTLVQRQRSAWASQVLELRARARDQEGAAATFRAAGSREAELHRELEQLHADHEELARHSAELVETVRRFRTALRERSMDLAECRRRADDLEQIKRMLWLRLSEMGNIRHQYDEIDGAGPTPPRRSAPDDRPAAS